MKRWSRLRPSNVVHAPWRSRVVAAIVLALFVAAPSGVAAPAEHVEPAASLARLLRELDRDQTRRLSGAADRNAPHLFQKLAARELGDRIEHAPGKDPVLVVIGVRGPRPNSAFEIERAIRVETAPGQAVGRQVLRLPQGRQAYERLGTLDNAATAEIAGLLATPADASEPRMSPSEALAPLSQKRRAAFVVAFSSSAVGPSPMIASLWVLPDSIQIDIAGDRIGLPEPEPGDTSSRSTRGFTPPPTRPTTTPSGRETGTEDPLVDPPMPDPTPADPGIQQPPDF